jgi:hypothetical protein
MAFGGVAVTPVQLLFQPYPTLANLRASDKQTAAGRKPSTDQAGSSAVNGNSAVISSAPEALQKRILDAAFARVVSANTSTRCAAAVWIISLLTFCASSPVVIAPLDAVQQIFLQLLGDPSELTQEVASRGLGVVHDAGDEETKARLVQALVGTLQGKCPAAQEVKLDGQSEVFEEGVVPATASTNEESASAGLLMSLRKSQ